MNKDKKDRRLSGDAQNLMFAWLAGRGAVSDDVLRHLMEEAANACEIMGLVGWLPVEEAEPAQGPESLEIPFGGTD